jgi:predicted  nucleic acid-binding Zn-ribbon protein
LESKLRYLYRLQYIDSNLDDLEEMKGDLPREIRTLEERSQALSQQHSLLDQTMKSAFSQRDDADSQIIALREKTERYKDQQTKVRTNKEYDLLMKEMDTTVETVARLEKEMEALENKADAARTEMETLALQIEEVRKGLEEKSVDLAEISKTTEEEETKFRNDRQKVVSKIAKIDLASYERIRKAKKGKAIVSVKRGACGGCFNRVPPQMILELKQNSRIYTCEHCGRILVSDEIVTSVTAGT